MGRSAVRARGWSRARLRPRPDLGLVATGADGEAVAGRDGVVPNLKGRAATVALVTRRPPRTGLSHESEYTNCYPDLDDGQVEEVGGVVLVRVEREVELLAMEATDPRDHVHLRAAAVGRWMVQGGETDTGVECRSRRLGRLGEEGAIHCDAPLVHEDGLVGADLRSRGGGRPLEDEPTYAGGREILHTLTARFGTDRKE